MSSSADKKQILNLLDRAKKMRDSGDCTKARQIIKNKLQNFQAENDLESRQLYAQLWYELGVCQVASCKVPNAIQSFERANKADPKATEASQRLVEHKIDSEGALSNTMVPLYLDYLDSGPDRNIRHGALRRLQQILRIRLTERPPVVIWRMEMLQKVHDLVPDLNFPKLYLGRGHYLQESYDLAVHMLSQLMGDAGKSHNVLNMLGRSYEKLGKHDEAYKLYDRSLRTTPGQAGVHFRLGRLGLMKAELK
ncbi:MAG: tetratricopeptide (TPR) repeat protein [Planctomycetota bacterium]|jgi:tetratricopeptide (TPR) repeat protein